MDHDKLLIQKSMPIKEAMQRLDITAKRVLYVVDETGRLKGSVTDGDIRRGLLRNANLDAPVFGIMNTTPKYIFESDNMMEKVSQCMISHKIESMPVLSRDFKVVKVVYWGDIFNERKSPAAPATAEKDNTVFILAGGKGTRLEPFTKVLPKPLIPIGETPVIEQLMDSFSKYGFGNFVVSINYRGEMIKAYFAESAAQKYRSMKYVQEKTPMGTIGSLALARDLLTEDFFVANCDILVEEDFSKVFEHHLEKKSALTIIGCIKQTILPYGVLNLKSGGTSLESIDEKPELHHVINTGMYVVNRRVLDYLKPDSRTDMNELISALLKNGENVGVYPVLDHQWFDIGQWSEFERTRKHFEKQ